MNCCDNLTPVIKLWSRVPYGWVRMQMPSDSRLWVTTGRPADSRRDGKVAGADPSEERHEAWVATLPSMATKPTLLTARRKAYATISRRTFLCRRFGRRQTEDHSLVVR